MMPKLIALALRRTIGSMPSTGTPKTWRSGHGVDVLALVEGLRSASMSATWAVSRSSICE
jgi:hypothetical protein